MADKKKKRTWKRELIEWGVLIAIAGVLYATGLHTEVIGRMQQVLLWTGIMQPEMQAPEQVSTQADYQYQLVSLDGVRMVNLSDLQGKVVFMNYWATWCPPCVAEMPNIQSLYDKMKSNDDIQFVMVNLDESREKAEKFIKDKGFTFPIYRPASATPKVFQSSTIPTTFVISRDGKIVSTHKGMAKYDTQKFRSYLKKLASERN